MTLNKSCRGSLSFRRGKVCLRSPWPAQEEAARISERQTETGADLVVSLKKGIIKLKGVFHYGDSFGFT